MITKINYVFLSLLLVSGICSCIGDKDNEIVLNLHQYQVPVLSNKENNPVLQMQLVPIDLSVERKVTEVNINLQGSSSIEDIGSLRLFYSDKKDFNSNSQYGTDQPPSSRVVFKDDVVFSDTTYLWLSIQLKDEIDLMNELTASCEYIRTARGLVRPDPSFEPKKLRVGKAVRQHMDDNVHTYRIPGLATTNSGTLLAIYDIRRESSRDLQGDIDIGLSRSTDGGNTWEPMKILLDMKEWGGLPSKFNGVSDANILVDKTNNNIYVAGLWMHGVLDEKGRWIEGLTESSDSWEHQWRRMGSQPGFGVKETSQFIVTKSTDDGQTWSEPVNLTRMCKKREWWLWAPAPGNGITLDDGTIVFPTQGIMALT